MKPNRLRIKTRLGVRHARSIRMGIRDLVDINEILDRWYGLHHPDLSEQMTVAGFQGRDWARMNIPIRDTEKLFEALGRLYADAYIYSTDITAYEIARAVGIRKSLSLSQEQLQAALQTQWKDWKAGNRAAAALLDPPDGLRRLLERRNLTIRGLASTTIDRIGTRLADGLRQGLSRDAVARSINEVLNDSVRSVTIAQTEMSRAIVQSNEDIYREAGVEMVEYLVVDPCVECQENLKASPLPLGESWPMGDPPVHPNCMCETSPYIVYEEKPEVSTIAEELTPVIPTAFSLTSAFDLPDIDRIGIFTTPEMQELQLYQRRLGYYDKPDLISQEQRLAVEKYQMLDYSPMNYFLRKPEQFLATESGAHANVIMGQVSNLSKVIENAPPLIDEIITYRGVKDSGADILRNLGVGSIYKEPGFASTSLNAKAALSFARNLKDDSMVIKIINPRGTKGLMMEGFFSAKAMGTEAEWLLPAGTRFEVLANNGKVIVVKVLS